MIGEPVLEEWVQTPVLSGEEDQWAEEAWKMFLGKKVEAFGPAVREALRQKKDPGGKELSVREVFKEGVRVGRLLQSELASDSAGRKD